MNRDAIPYLQIRKREALLYWRTDYQYVNYAKIEARKAQIQEDRKKAYSGEISKGAKKRMRAAVDLLLQATRERWVYNPIKDKSHKFTISFITLTVSEARRNLDLKEGYEKLLKPFLRVMREKWGCSLYIWKAEYQKRGQLHYHITTDQFIRYNEIRDVWNKLQRKGGYLNDYARRYKNYDPNSTDVHSVYKVRNMQAYLTKYLTKPIKEEKKAKDSTMAQSGNESATNSGKQSSRKGKVWGCSEALQKAKFFTVVPCSENTNLLLSAKRVQSIEEVKTDHCYIYRCFKTVPERLLTKKQQAEYQSYLKDIRTPIKQ